MQIPMYVNDPEAVAHKAVAWLNPALNPE